MALSVQNRVIVVLLGLVTSQWEKAVAPVPMMMVERKRTTRIRSTYNIIYITIRAITLYNIIIFRIFASDKNNCENIKERNCISGKIQIQRDFRIKNCSCQLYTDTFDVLFFPSLAILSGTTGERERKSLNNKPNFINQGKYNVKLRRKPERGKQTDNYTVRVRYGSRHIFRLLRQFHSSILRLIYLNHFFIL